MNKRIHQSNSGSGTAGKIVRSLSSAYPRIYYRSPVIVESQGRIRRRFLVSENEATDEMKYIQSVETLNEDPEFGKSASNQKKRVDIEKDLQAIEKWKKWVRVVKLMCTVCTAFQRYSGSVVFDAGLKRPYSSVDDNNENNKLYFNPKDFKTKYEFTWPDRDKACIMKLPKDRTQEDIATIKQLLRGLHSFRKYTVEMQDLLCRVVRYCHYGKNRVVVRKGHVGQSFYFIFSGAVSVVFDKDSDSIFVRPEVSILRKGEVFGEIALLKNTRRNASIVCFDETEMLAVDREDFYEYGLFDIMQKELQYRKDFLGRLEMFKTWSPAAVEDLCFLSRIEEHNYNRVIVQDTRKSEWLYFVSKGSCDVLRLIDLTRCPDFDDFLPEDRRPTRDNDLPSIILDMETSLGYCRSSLAEKQAWDQAQGKDTGGNISLIRQLSLAEKPKNTEQLRTYYARNVQLTSTHAIQSSEQLKEHYTKSAQLYLRPATSVNISVTDEKIDDYVFANGIDSATSTSIMIKKASDLEIRRVHSASPASKNARVTISTSVPQNDSSPSPSPSAHLRRVRRRSTLVRSNSFIEDDVGDDGFIGIGLFVKIDHVLPGEVFGMTSVLNEKAATKRYSLISKGGEVVRVPKSRFKQLMDIDTVKRVEKLSQKLYPSDDELCRHFMQQTEWNLFREDIVELVRRHMPQKRSRQRCQRQQGGSSRHISDYMRRRDVGSINAKHPSGKIFYASPKQPKTKKENNRATSAPLMSLRQQVITPNNSRSGITSLGSQSAAKTTPSLSTVVSTGSLINPH
ncbi:cyclic nucleotide-binding domain-containing protein 2-like isoform X2 [Tubulanus polymorphus]|uniref:cyclic nucleotide-binding domain-containing protein 2-like isoform X2 n=1 Tax=Tubulanus polymorphus TaxID=672921 RepID=UPI003DA38E27